MRPPTKFEPAQAFIVQGSPPQMHFFAPHPGMSFDCFPHEEIVAAQMLLRFVRGTKLINGLSIESEEHCSRDHFPVMPRQRYCAQVSRKHMPVNVLKKNKWLRRQTMLFACLA